MSQWKSAVSIGKQVTDFNEGELVLSDFVAAVQAEFRENPFYASPDIRMAVEALVDMPLPDIRGEGSHKIRELDDGEVLGECERRLQMLEVVAAKDHRIYVSRVLRHFER
jgi:hypothetical protein